MTVLLHAHPPTTPFVCAVGVTGHRTLPSENAAAIARAASDILSAVRDEVARQSAVAPPGLFSPCPPLLRCLSPLAAGADRIVAGQALGLGYELQTPLPFFREEYENDFAEASSKREFRALLARASAVLELDGSRADAEEAYLAAGQVVLEQSDVLLAVWDGALARGRGGTGQIVEKARKRGLPVVVVDPARPAAIRFLGQEAGGDWRKALAACIEHLVLPPAPPTEEKRPATWRERLKGCFSGNAPGGTSPTRYFAETLPRPTLLGRFPSLFEKALGHRKDGSETASPATVRTRDWPRAARDWLCALFPGKAPCPEPAESAPCGWCDALGLERADTRLAEERLAEHYGWADRLAVHYAARYRAVGYLRHLLMAVVLVGVFIGSYVKHFDAVGFGIQVLAFALILFLIRVNTLGNWHQRFLDYRFLAEQLRHMRFLFLLGCMPPFARKSPGSGAARESWPAWHLRNVARQAGLVPARMDAALLARYRQRLDDDVIADQIQFYIARQDRFDLVARRLSSFGIWCFIAGLGFILLRFLIFLWVKEDTALPLGIAGGSLRTVCNEIALVIPSLASMAFALRAQGEYATLGSRYAHTRMVLVHKSQDLQAMTRLTRGELADFSEKLATVLSSEVSGWHVLVKNKTVQPY